MRKYAVPVSFLVIGMAMGLALPQLQAQQEPARIKARSYQCTSSTSRKQGLHDIEGDANRRAAQGWRMVNFTATGLNPVTFHACYER